jgi:hypothetical protein
MVSEPVAGRGTEKQIKTRPRGGWMDLRLYLLSLLAQLGLFSLSKRLSSALSSPCCKYTLLLVDREE